MKQRILSLTIVGALMMIAGVFQTVPAQVGELKLNPATEENQEKAVQGASAASGKVGARLGVYLTDVKQAQIQALGLKEARGAYVGRVLENSPAEKAGLSIGDVLVGFNDIAVENASHLYRLLSEAAPERNVTISLRRNKELRTVTAVLAERLDKLDEQERRLLKQAELFFLEEERYRKAAEELRLKGDQAGAEEKLKQAAALREQGEAYRLHIENSFQRDRQALPAEAAKGEKPLPFDPAQPGVSVMPLSEQLAQFFNVKGGRGLLVTEVKPATLVEQSGLKAGDCIVAVNGEQVGVEAELLRLLNRAQERAAGKISAEDKVVSLLIVRERNEQIITLRFP